MLQLAQVRRLQLQLLLSPIEGIAVCMHDRRLPDRAQLGDFSLEAFQQLTACIETAWCL